MQSISIEVWPQLWSYILIQKSFCVWKINLSSSSGHVFTNFTKHKSPNFFNQILFVYFLRVFYKVKVFNQDQNTPKYADITVHIKNVKTLGSPLNWWNWSSCFVKLVKTCWKTFVLVSNISNLPSCFICQTKWTADITNMRAFKWSRYKSISLSAKFGW